MGPVCHYVYAALSVAFAVIIFVVPGIRTMDHREELIMTRSPEPIAVPIGDEVTLTCEMNVKADSFRWRHFPISSPYSNTPVKLDRDVSYEVPSSMYKNNGKGTIITINVNSTSVAGDYQCLVSYGASILASVPGRITIAEIGKTPPPKNLKFTVTPGNTVAIKCDLPPSNPQASVEYYRNHVPLDQALVLPSMTLLLQNVSRNDNGTYTCSANNYITGETKICEQKTVLTVTNSKNQEFPKFLTVPPNNYTVTAGATVFMECSAVGNPPPTVTWYKLEGEINSKKTEFLPGGLQIKNVTSKDQGTYVCAHGNLKHYINLLFYEKPSIIFSPPPRITEGEDLDLECIVKGTPEPYVSWFLNGRSVRNETNVEVVGNQIYFRPVEKKDAGILQCLATNVVGSTYEFTFLKIIPKQIATSMDQSSTIINPRRTENTEKNNKPKKKSSKNPVMIPPSKPNVSRVSDESVMVRWTVPSNDGLPIQFFKVQYRELGPASQMNGSGRNKGWKTTNADIIPYLRSYQVDNLKPDHIYRFRIAAVYSNNDNKLGPNSAKFHLKREDFFAKNPLPAPKLTKTEALSPFTIKIFWDYIPNPNITIDGFYVNYQLTSSAGDYFKATVDGEQARTYEIHHLQPDTAYDIKLQSYTTSGVSDFSAVLQQKTLRLPDEVTTTQPTKKEETNDQSQLFIIIIVVVVVSFLLLGAIVAFIIIKKKKSKDSDGNEANDLGEKTGGTEEGRHQINANGYTTKAIPRLSNGCTPNRITITSNPLADADDNQNQNMIEMSCLSSQNNNCSTVEPSVSNENAQPLPSKIKSTDNIKTRGKMKTEVTAGENYV